MLHRRPGPIHRHPLRRLDSRYLEGQEKLGLLDRQITPRAAYPCLGRRVQVQLRGESSQVRRRERRRGGELVERELQRRGTGFGEVDRGEGDAVGGDVGDVADGFRVATRDGGGDGRHGVADFLREGRVADDEAGILAAGEGGGGGGEG